MIKIKIYLSGVPFSQLSCPLKNQQGNCMPAVSENPTSLVHVAWWAERCEPNLKVLGSNPSQGMVGFSEAQPARGSLADFFQRAR